MREVRLSNLILCCADFYGWVCVTQLHPSHSLLAPKSRTGSSEAAAAVGLSDLVEDFD